MFMERKLRYILLISCFITCSNLCQATKYALVVGIGEYPIENGWTSINGDNDIALVRDILFANGFSDNNIYELRNAEATASAIRQGFDNLITLVQKGDIIYIHFSGHGQQVTDLNGDEEDGWDEAWIPFDAQKTYFEGIYEGQNHILDDDINKLFWKWTKEHLPLDAKVNSIFTKYYILAKSLEDDEFGCYNLDEYNIFLSSSYQTSDDVEKIVSRYVPDTLFVASYMERETKSEIKDWIDFWGKIGVKITKHNPTKINVLKKEAIKVIIFLV